MPAISHPHRQPHTRLKRLRALAGLTQQALAEKIGTSLATIVAVETGSLQMSKNLAARIMVVTGVDPESLLHGPELKGVMPDEAFDQEMVRNYLSVTTTNPPGRGRPVKFDQRYGFRFADPNLEQQTQKMMEKIIFWAGAAAAANRFHIFEYLFEEWIEQTAQALGLEVGVGRLLTAEGIENNLVERAQGKKQFWQQPDAPNVPENTQPKKRTNRRASKGSGST